MITQTYNLNLIPDKVPVSVDCSQYDSLSRTIVFNIYDGTVLKDVTGATATVRGTKSDNTGFEYPCTIDGSQVSFDIQDQMTIFSGRVPCEIRLINNGILGSCNFVLNVEPTPLDPNVTISETDLPLLEEAEQNAIRAEQAADEAESVLASAVKSVNNILPDSQGNVNVSGALPGGGTQGQVLTKQSSATGDVGWDDIDALPTGGTQGQVLTKRSSTDGDADWQNIQALPSGGTQGQFLVKNSSTQGDASWSTKEVILTQDEYDALPDTKLTNGVSYFITDGESAPSTNKFSADGISYGTGSVADKLNLLNGQIKIVTSGSINSLTESGIYYCTSAVTDVPLTGGGVLVIGVYNNATAGATYISWASVGACAFGRKNSNTWSWVMTPNLTAEVITGTTTASGAIEVPQALRSKMFVNATMTSQAGFVFRRDPSYFTVMNNDLNTPIASTSVTFTAYFLTI